MDKKTFNSATASKEPLNKTWVIISIIITSGIILRCFRLSFQSYWFDEVMSIEHILGGSNFFKWLARGFTGDPPLYEFLLYFWIKIFGQSETAVRALSVIFSAATLPAIYLLSKELFDNKTAVYSVFLLSFSAYHIYYAQEARMYSLVGLLVVSSGIFFAKGLKNDRKINWVMYSIATIAAFYAHYSALFVVLAEAIILCLYRRKYKIKLWHWLGSLSAIVIMMLPWLLVSLIPHFIIPVFIEKKAYLWIDMPSFKTVFDTFIFFVGGQEWLIRNLGQNYWLSCKAVLIIIALMFLVNLWLVFKQKESPERKVSIIFLVLWCFLPVIIVYSVSVLVQPIYMVRYVDVALFSLYILIAQALSKVRPVYLRIIFLSAYLILNIVALNYYYRFQVKTPMRDIAHFLKSRQVADDKILVYDHYGISVIKYYYPEISGNITDFTPEAVKDVISRRRDFWCVVTADNKNLIEDLKGQGLVGQDFANIYQQAEMKQIGAVKISRFKKSPPFL
jgi:uncharacterized membrane protein